MRPRLSKSERRALWLLTVASSLVLAMMVRCTVALAIQSPGQPATGQWVQIGLAGLDVAALSGDPGDSSRLYAWLRGCRNFATIEDHRDAFQVTEGGRSWTGQVIGATLCSPSQPQLKMDDGILFAITHSGFGRSADRGATWHLASRSQVTSRSGRPDTRPTGERALAVVSGASRQVFVDIGPDWNDTRYPGFGVLMSADDGETWQRIGPGLQHAVSSIVVDPLSPATLYLAAGQDGIWRSDDLGMFWRHLDQAPPAATSLMLRPARQNVIYATGTDDSPGLWQTTDGGDSWIKLRDDAVDCMIPDIRDPNGDAVIIRHGEWGGLWSIAWSGDGGTSWSELGNPVNPRPNLPGALLVVGDSIVVGSNDGIWQYPLPVIAS
jgi:photosystem II stability/assembly factor-like uncharacterized protein